LLTSTVRRSVERRKPGTSENPRFRLRLWRGVQRSRQRIALRRNTIPRKARCQAWSRLLWLFGQSSEWRLGVFLEYSIGTPSSSNAPIGRPGHRRSCEFALIRPIMAGYGYTTCPSLRAITHPRVFSAVAMPSAETSRSATPALAALQRSLGFSYAEAKRDEQLAAQQTRNRRGSDVHQ